MAFETQPLSKPSVLLTPWMRAKQEWDDRLGTALVAGRNWRYACFGTLVLAGMLGAGLVYQANQSLVVPYVVEVDKTGAVVRVAAAAGAYEPSDAQIAYQLRKFIEQIRSKPTDAIVIKANWQEAYAFLTQAAAAQLTRYATENDPFARVGKEAITVEVLNVIRQSPQSFQIHWREKQFTDGNPTTVKQFTGLFAIKRIPPTTEQALYRNPLGIYFDSPLTWTEDHSGSAP